VTEYDVLVRLYEQIYEDGFFIREFERIAAVGDVRDLEYLARLHLCRGRDSCTIARRSQSSA
jgi:hypothetical protein